jgi:hypothetical protein
MKISYPFTSWQWWHKCIISRMIKRDRYSDPLTDEWLNVIDIPIEFDKYCIGLEKTEKLEPTQSSGPWWYPKLDSSWLCRNPCSLCIGLIEFVSYKQKRLPSCWKQANITPIPKEKPVKDISKQLRPISLTPVLSKLAEEFFVEKYIAPAVLSSIDPFQFGGIPRSSATKALISMVHAWTQPQMELETL